MKYYKFPIMFSLEPGNSDINLDGSETTVSGDIFDMYTFDEAIDEDDLNMIVLNCDSFALAEMDTNNDQIISLDEFEAWLAAHPW